MNACLDWLEDQCSDEGFMPGYFSVLDIALLCPLAYAETRGVIDWRQGHPRLERNFERWHERPSVAETAERG